jgi:hypothetical protein
MNKTGRTAWSIATAFAVMVAGAWIAMAADAGMLIPHETRLAVKPGEFTPDVFFDVRKKLIEVDGRQIAHVEMGQREPVILLHGRPFRVYEWHYALPAMLGELAIYAAGHAVLQRRESYAGRTSRRRRRPQSALDRTHALLVLAEVIPEGRPLALAQRDL